MTTTTAADVSRYRAIHAAMRVSDDRLVAGVASMHDGDRDRARALRRWFAGYAAELHGHHRIEDTIFFPALGERVPVFSTYAETLAADHDRLDTLIDDIAGTLAALESGTRAWSPAHDHLRAATVELRDLLVAHLDFEDRDVLPLFERHFTAEEYGALDQAAVRTVGLSKWLFTVPWWMASVDARTAEHDRANAPLLMKAIWYATRGGYARLSKQAFGTATGATSADPESLVLANR
jgi:hemerythrin-like domain-containing protein